MNLAQYGNIALGKLAFEDGVINSKDSYERRKKVVNRWLSENYTQEFVSGARDASRNRKRRKRTAEYLAGYREAQSLLD